MGFAVGDGIAVFSVCAVIVTGILKLAPGRNGRYVPRDICKVIHKGVDDKLESLGKDISEIKKDLKALVILAQRQGDETQ